VDVSDSIKLLVECLYPSGVYLSVFYAQVDESAPKQMEDEPIAWFPVEQIIKDYDVIPLAGEGNVRYFVEASLNAIIAEA